MIKPDVVVVWPSHVDYPLFMDMLHRYQDYFNGIYVGVSDHHMPEENYIPSVMADFARTIKIPFGFIAPPSTIIGDWRSQVTNELMGRVTAPYTLFIEQDFIIPDRRIFEVVLQDGSEYNAFLFNDNGRLHPAFALIETQLVRETDMDFGANPPVYDHFGKFFRQLKGKARAVELDDLGLHSGEDFYHMAGLTNNYQRYAEGQPLYKTEEFLTYNYLCVPFANEPFKQKVDALEELRKKQNVELNEEFMAFYLKGGKK